MRSAATQFRALVGRELRSVVRTPSYVLLGVGIALVVFWLAVGGGGSATGYVPAVVDLLLPLELVVPLAAVAVGYRSVVSDLERGELDVLESYGVPAWVYVSAVYVGRAAVLSAILAGSLAVVGVVIATTAQPDFGFYATHMGVDSPVLFGRFVVATVLFGLAMLAVVVFVSVLARSTRTALAVAVGALLLIGGGGDALVILGLTDGWLADRQLLSALAVVPNSAYRGLVFETVIGVTSAVDTGYAAPLWNAAGLVAWLAGSLLAATGLLAYRRR